MKIRQGFVSNSSSSSFICQMTGDIEEGYFASPSDVGMVECPNNHVFYEKFKIEVDDKIELKRKIVAKFKKDADIDDEKWYAWLKEDVPEDDEEFIDWFYGNDIEADCRNFYGATISEEECPFCQMRNITRDDMIELLPILLKMTREQIAEEMKKEFGNYENFSQYLKKNKK